MVYENLQKLYDRFKETFAQKAHSHASLTASTLPLGGLESAQRKRCVSPVASSKRMEKTSQPRTMIRLHGRGFRRIQAGKTLATSSVDKGSRGPADSLCVDWACSRGSGSGSGSDMVEGEGLRSKERKKRIPGRHTTLD